MAIDLGELRTAAIVVRNLPEMPGYNGSLLAIDDVEAARIEKSITAGVDEIEKLRTLVKLIFASTLPYNDGEPTFSDKVTDLLAELMPNG